MDLRLLEAECRQKQYRHIVWVIQPLRENSLTLPNVRFPTSTALQLSWSAEATWNKNNMYNGIIKSKSWKGKQIY